MPHLKEQTEPSNWMKNYRTHRTFLWAHWVAIILFLFTGIFYQDSLLWITPSWGQLLFVAFFMSRHIGWFALVLWLVALVPMKRSIYAAILGLVLASSFLVFNQVYVTFKSSEWVEILGYGWGYMFWLWAFVFLVGDKLLVGTETHKTKIGTMIGVLVGCAIAAIPSAHTYLERSQYLSEREAIFQNYCDQSGVSISESVQSPPPGGIFPGPRALSIFVVKMDSRSDQLYREYVGSLPDYFEEWEELIEEFADISIKESRNVLEAQMEFRHLSVVRNADDVTLAEFAYVFDIWDGKYCPDDLMEFSELDFYRQVFPFAEFE